MNAACSDWDEPVGEAALAINPAHSTHRGGDTHRRCVLLLRAHGIASQLHPAMSYTIEHVLSRQLVCSCLIRPVFSCLSGVTISLDLYVFISISAFHT